MKIKFLYHAEAVAASGHLTLPVVESMEIQASIALPLLGGQGSSRVEKFRHRNYFSFDSAESHVVGSFSEKDKAHGTLATTTIEGLNIMDVVTCDRIVARITSKHPDSRADSSFIPLGSRFENLRIAGHRFDVDLATDLFAEHHTWPELKGAHAKNRKVRAEINRLSLVKRPNGRFPESKGRMAFTLARNLDKLPAGLARRGHGIYVHHFGTVYLGEYFVSSSYHRLLMLHVDLGCSVEGCYGIGGAGGNGDPPPSS